MTPLRFYSLLRQYFWWQGGGGILDCHISTRAAFICRTFTGIIILCRCVGMWAEGHSECIVWICTCRTSTCNEQCVCGGRKKTTSSSNTSPKVTAAQNSANRSVDDSRENWDSSGKWPNIRVRQSSDPVRYGMTSQLRCVWASRTWKKFLERPLDKVSRATAWRTTFIWSRRGRSTDWVIDTGQLLQKVVEYYHIASVC